MRKLLESIHSPKDIKKLSPDDIKRLSEEIRETIISTVSSNGGHLASNLGVVELTLSLLLSFDLPQDSIVWDVGHQAYAYKLLTGRYYKFFTLRQEKGISGFPSREESDYDLFTSGHSSTSISGALGISEANTLQDKDGYVVAVIGDGALSGGLAYEGLNNVGRLHQNLIVILNDNTMSISKNVGSMARYLTYMRTRPNYIRMKNTVEFFFSKIPFIGKWINRVLRKIKSVIKGLFYRRSLFENLGFAYYGPFDGHNIRAMNETLKSAKLIRKPVMIHIKTEKGRGYKFAEQSPSDFHGLSGFNVSTGKKRQGNRGFSHIFGETLCELAENNDKICAITASMTSSTGLSEFRSRFKNRFFDVGIAEEHAVVFAGGLAIKGMVPVFAVYSTFLQRSYDELIHDVSLQNTKIVLAIDNAGIVGDDGRTHQGLFDAAFLQTIPHVTLYSPTYFTELRIQFQHIIEDCDGLSAIRYPKGNELYKPPYFHDSINPYDVYGDEDADVVLVTYGRLFSFAAECESALAKEGFKLKLLKLNRIIPIDPAAINSINHAKYVFFYEEGVKRGGIGSEFSCLLHAAKFRGDYYLKAIDDPFISQSSIFRTLERLELTSSAMKSAILRVCGSIDIVN